MKKGINYWVGTGFGAGMAPIAPGTMGSLVACIPAWFMVQHYGLPGLLFLFVAFLILGYVSAPWFIREIGEDPGIFVMDEWAGQMIPIGIVFVFPEIKPDYTIHLFVTAFLLFRLFDITKPLGIKKIERLWGANGIMLDDVAAGFYAFTTLFFAILAYLAII